MRKKYSIKNSVIGALCFIITTILGFVTRIVFIKSLGIIYVGYDGLFSSILSTLSLFELGIESSITFCLYKVIRDNDVDKIAGIMNFFKKLYWIIGGTIFGVVVIIVPFINVLIKDKIENIQYIQFIFLLYALNSVLSYFLAYKRTLIIAKQQKYIINQYELVFQILLYICLVVQLLLTQSYVIYLIIKCIYTIVINLLIAGKCNSLNPYIKNNKAVLDGETKRFIFNSIKFLCLIKLFSVGILLTDNLIISAFIGIRAVGMYSNYLMVISGVRGLFLVLLHGVSSSFGDLVAEANIEKIQSYFNIYNTVSFLFASFATVSFAILLQPFIILWIGKSYLLSNIIVFIIIMNNYIFLMRQPVIIVQGVSGLFKEVLPTSGLELVIKLLVSIVLVSKMGLIGLFIGVMCAYTISNILQAIILHKLVLKESSKKYFINQSYFLIILFIEILIVYGLSLLITDQGLFGFLIRIALCISIPNIVNAIVLWRTKELVWLLSELRYGLIKII